MDKLKEKKKRGNLADFIVDHNKGIRNIALILVVFNLICYFFVGVNYDLTAYLPDTAVSKIAINKMKEVFGYPGTGRLMLKDVSLYEAKEYKNELEKIDGVDQVVWCDTTTQIYASSEFINYDDIEDYYKDNCAVMDVTFKEGDTSKRTQQAIDDIEDLIGDKGYIVGMSPTQKFIEENVKSQMTMIMTIAVVVVFIILLLTTTSYFEPVLFLTVIGSAIALNKGTNIFFGEISFITNNICDVLQLATSMDYSVFLLHAYERERENGLTKIPALKKGLNNTINTVLSSSLTTLFGFLALALMRFKLGPDLGYVMSKSILCSLFMVIFFMPSMLLLWSDRIDKTRHKPFLPRFHRFSVVVNRLSPYILGVALLLAVPCYVAQNMNNFNYGNEAVASAPGTSIYDQTEEINAKFGRSNLLVAIIPNESADTEKEIIDKLDDLDYVKTVMGMSEYLPDGVPESILPKSITELFHKDGYTRLLIYIKTKSESQTAFKDYEEIKALLESYYPDETYIAGSTPSTLDMRSIMSNDYSYVNVVSMLLVFLVVAISFHSLLLPTATMIPILIATYVNMAFPYLVGDTMLFIGYIVVSSIQLGATIDYAILSTENYIQIRQHEPDKKRAAELMTEMSFPSILTSGSILVVCGYAIYKVSSIPAISEVGHLVGRGAIFSILFVVGCMPCLLKLIDKFIVVPKGMKKKMIRAKIHQAAVYARNRRRRRHERIKKALRRLSANVGGIRAGAEHREDRSA